MKEIKVTVNGINRKEYFDAFHQSAKRIYLILAAIVAAVTAVVVIATGNANLPAFLGPMMIYAALLVLLEIVVRRSYKDEMVKMEPVCYTMDANGWSIQRGSEKAAFSWKDTPKVNFSRGCIFLYNSKTSSNMIPRRLLSVKEEQQIRIWLKASREKK